MRIEVDYKKNMIWANKVNDAINIGLETAMEYLKNETVINTPKDTGNLQKSYRTRVENNKGKYIGVLANNAEYATYVEYAVNKKPRGQGIIPFMRPTLNNSAKTMKTIITREMKSKL